MCEYNENRPLYIFSPLKCYQQNAEMRSVELEQSRVASLAKASPSSSSAIIDQVKQSSNVNRYSNDSGVVDVDLVRPSEMAASAEIHRAPVGVGSRSRPHSIHSGKTPTLDDEPYKHAEL